MKAYLLILPLIFLVFETSVLAESFDMGTRKVASVSGTTQLHQVGYCDIKNSQTHSIKKVYKSCAGSESQFSSCVIGCQVSRLLGAKPYCGTIEVPESRLKEICTE